MRLMQLHEQVEGRLPPLGVRSRNTRDQLVRGVGLADRVRDFARGKEVPVAVDDQAELQGSSRGTRSVGSDGR
eukprot:10448785-Heterocapsa_arctica.AAC.1